MYLTRHSDYTLRLLIYLAVEPEQSATIQDVAAHYGISRNHMMKVANHAVQGGYVKGVRGRAGGLRLAKPAALINIGDVLRRTENWNTAECFDAESNSCPITGGCGLRPILSEALAAYFAVLDRFSLADVVRRRSALVQLLGLKSA